MSKERKTDEKTLAIVQGHLLIKDKETKKILVNKRA